MQRCAWIEYDQTQCVRQTTGILCPYHAAKASKAYNTTGEIAREMTRKFGHIREPEQS